MIPRISDLFDMDCLQEQIGAGYIRQQHHWSEPLSILNYTEACVFERKWNDITLNCRGLIYNTETGAIVARPWRKFFNYGERPIPAEWLDASAEVTNKMDGSLGICYREPSTGNYAIATRGSFASEQAAHATAILRERYPEFKPSFTITCLFEIIYPANRIVLDYGDTDDLVLLGCVFNADGKPYGPLAAAEVSGWPRLRTETFPAPSLRRALEMPPRDNAEGVVVRLLDSGDMFKIKQEDYVALHKIVTNLSERSVWEHIANGRNLADICESLPDELHPWVRDVASRLIGRANVIEGDARTEHQDIKRKIRRHYAEHAKQSPNAPYLFMLYDDRDPYPAIWKTLKPSAESRPRPIAEDEAA